VIPLRVVSRQAKQRNALLKAFAGSLGRYQKPISLDITMPREGAASERGGAAPDAALPCLFVTTA